MILMDAKHRIMYSFRTNSYITKDDIVRLVYLLVEDYSLDDYLEHIDFEKTYKHNLALYLVNDKKLVINLDNINYFYNNWFHNKGIALDQTSLIRFYDLYVIRIIVHEFKHIFQVKESITDEQDSKSIILKDGIGLGRRSPNNLTFKEKLLYKYLHDFVPTEKNAETTSLGYLININNEDSFLYSDEEFILYQDFINELLKGYEIKKELCPTEIYYRIRGMSDEFANIPFDEEYDTLTRLSWGMPVNEEIINDIKRIKRTMEYKRIHTILN